MALNADNVMVGVTGMAAIAPLGTELPTSTEEKLSEEFIDVGYISEDGISQTTDTSTEDIKGWQNGTVVRTLQTEHTLQLAFGMIEITPENLKLYYADPDATKDAVKVTGKQSEQYVVVFDVVDGKKIQRIVVPKGQITEREDISYKNDEAITYGVTLSCFPDEQGVKAYIYSGETLPQTKPKATATLSNRAPAAGQTATARVKVKNNG